MQIRHLLIPTSLACLAAIPAQTPTCNYAPDNQMSGSNVIPFGSTQGTISTWGNQKYMSLILPQDVGNTPGLITSLAVGGSNTGVRHHQTIRIRMDYFQGTGTSMSPTFDNNISSNAVTVLESTDYAWTQVGATWSRLGLQTPFAYVPQLGPLVVEITATGSYLEATGAAGLYNSTLRQRLYAISWVGTPPAAGTIGSSAAIRFQVCYGDQDLNSFGRGCIGSNQLMPKVTLSGSAARGQTFTVALASAPAVTPTFLSVGLTPYTSPIDLAIAGAPGCRLYHAPLALVGQVTDAAGAISILAAAPMSASAVGTSVYVQFAPSDRQANAMGMTVSDFGRVLFGY